MNKLDIYCFTSIARTKSFSITARELMISQQAVSGHIRSLEAELGYTLFFRYGQSAELTKAGEMLLEFFIDRDLLTDQFLKTFKKDRDNHVFRIGWTQWAACPDYLQKLLDGFQQINPAVHYLVEVLSAKEYKKALREKALDFLFTSQYASEYMPVAWEKIPLGKQRLYLVHSKRAEYKEKARESYPFFAIPAGESDDYITMERTKATCQKAGFVPKNIYICPDMGSAFLNVITRNGLTFATAAAFDSKNENYVLTPTGIFSDYVMSSPYYIVNPWAIQFKNFILDHAEKINAMKEEEIR